jgi:NitT/TauT family transport system ATP-binding protein
MLADRVILLSSQPASVKAVVDIPLDRPRDARISESSEFVALTRQIREQLKDSCETCAT